MSRHPQLRFELVVLARVIDRVDEGVDVGVRLAHLPGPSLGAVPVGETRRMVLCAPSLVRRH